MLTSLDKFDHAAVVGCCARRAEISVALPPNRDIAEIPTTWSKTAHSFKNGPTK
jgi:hypothetical protein